MKKKITVVIADDDRSFAFFLKDKLENSDKFHVLGVACDGEQAVNQILDKRPELVILDLIMPKMDGFAVLEKMNKFS